MATGRGEARKVVVAHEGRERVVITRAETIQELVDYVRRLMGDANIGALELQVFPPSEGVDAQFRQLIDIEELHDRDYVRTVPASAHPPLRSSWPAPPSSSSFASSFEPTVPQENAQPILSPYSSRQANATTKIAYLRRSDPLPPATDLPPSPLEPSREVIRLDQKTATKEKKAKKC